VTGRELCRLKSGARDPQHTSHADAKLFSNASDAGAAGTRAMNSGDLVGIGITRAARHSCLSGPFDWAVRSNHTAEIAACLGPPPAQGAALGVGAGRFKEPQPRGHTKAGAPDRWRGSVPWRSRGLHHPIQAQL
jgi:hypothetical protein